MEKIIIKSGNGETQKTLLEAMSILFPECRIEIMPDASQTGEWSASDIGQTEFQDF